MKDLLTELDAVSWALAEQPTFALDEHSLIDAHASLWGTINRLIAVDAGLVRQIDAHGIARAAGSANASAWLREHSRMSITEAHKLAALGKLLDSRSTIRDAVHDGAVTCEQALAIGRALTDIPADAGTAVTDKVEVALVALAHQFEPALLRKLGDRALAHIAPEVAENVLERRLAREEREAARSRSLTLTPDGLGRTRLRGILDTESAAIVNAALKPLMKPIPIRAARTSDAGTSDTGQPVSGELGSGELGSGQRGSGQPGSGQAASGQAGSGGPGSGKRGSADVAVGEVDMRSAAARRADALVEVCRLALRTGELPHNGGQAPQLNITIDVDALRDGVSGGVLDTGEALSAGALRRLACDAQILPIVLNGASVPIDVGRARRLYIGAARTAILIRDGGCAFPGCDRPPRWTDIHHMISWIDGGPTDQDNGVALCGYHHRFMHRQDDRVDGGWQVRMGSDGHPEFQPPLHVDPGRTPRRNPYHLRT